MSRDQALWGDIGAPLARLEYIPRDNSWLKLLPEGCSLISAVGHGASYWSQSGKIELRLEDGSQGYCFIKLSQTHVGRMMAEGEYESMRLLNSISPEMVPKPIGYGTFETDDNMHFFLSEFLDMHEELPDVLEFCKGIADLHLRSQDLSPTGKFGFAITTCNGKIPQYTKWTSSWEEFFIKSLETVFKKEESVQGFSPEITDMLPALYTKVCPRLLRPMETNGNVVRPSLVHGDLWSGNVAVHASSGKPCIFDSSALWAHNEYELHIWRPERFRFGKPYVTEYFKHIAVSAPEDDFEDRHLLYSIVADLYSSALHRGTDTFRNLVIENMKILVNKFPNGYEGDAHQKV